MTEVKASAWVSFVSVFKNFLGKHNAENYEEQVQDMLLNFQKIGVNMSIKLHHIHNYLTKFPRTLVVFVRNQGCGFTRT